MQATLTFLGSGTSMGVPTLGCDCAVCTSATSPGGDPRNRRTRPSVLISWEGHNVVIDTGPDFHAQAVRALGQDVRANPGSGPADHDERGRRGTGGRGTRARSPGADGDARAVARRPELVVRTAAAASRRKAASRAFRRLTITAAFSI